MLLPSQLLNVSYLSIISCSPFGLDTGFARASLFLVLFMFTVIIILGRS